MRVMVKVSLTLPVRPPVSKAVVSRYIPGVTSLISGSMGAKNVLLMLRVKKADLLPQPEEAPASAETVHATHASTTSDYVIMTKVRAQQRFLRGGTVPPDKRSDCWWCAGSFENDPFLIPHSVSEGEVLGYGSFCIPQCAVAYLYAEKGLDMSVMFERDQMLNHCYGRASSIAPGERCRIPPAHDPKLLLQKYCGTLTYPEYRRLCASNYLFSPAERPLTHIVSELHDVIDPLVLKEFGGTPSLGSNGYRVKMAEANNQLGKGHKTKLPRGFF